MELRAIKRPVVRLPTKLFAEIKNEPTALYPAAIKKALAMIITMLRSLGSTRPNQKQ